MYELKAGLNTDLLLLDAWLTSVSVFVQGDPLSEARMAHEPGGAL